MAVALKSLRITAGLDASDYARGAQQKADADAKMIASGKAVAASEAETQKAVNATGVTVEQTDRKISASVSGIDRLRRAHVEGFAAVHDFERGLKTLNAAMEKNPALASQAAQILDGLTKKYGVVASEADAARLKLGADLTGVVMANAKALDAQAEAHARLARVQAQSAQVAVAGQSQQAVRQLLGVQDFAPIAAEVQADYANFWKRVIDQQQQAAVAAAGQSQKTVNELLGVRHFASLSREVEADYSAMWGRLLDEQEQAGARAAQIAANENAKLAAAYGQVMSSIDPVIAQQQRYDRALADLRAGAAAAGRSVEQLAQDEARLAAAMSPAVLAAQKEASELEALKARADPAAASLRRLAEDQKALDAAYAAGKLNPEEYASYTAAVSKHKTMVEQSTVSQKAMTNAVGLTKAQMSQLTPQINDVVSGLLMGQPPMMIFAQQSGQIVQALQAGGATLPTFTAGTIALGAAVATAVVAVAAATAAHMAYAASAKEVDRLNRLYGAGVGLTTDQLLAQADAAAASAGVSKLAARDIQNSYLATGKIGGQVMSDLTKITRDYAAATAQDVDKASSDLAGMFSDPAKAVDELNSKYRMFDDSQTQLIKNYQAQGQLERAQIIILDEMRNRIQGAGDRLAWYTKLWEKAKGLVVDAGSLVAPATKQEEADFIQKRLSGATGKLSSREVDDLTAQLSALNQEINNDNIAAWATQVRADFDKTTVAVGDFARSVDPAQAATTAFANAQALINDAVAKYPSLQAQGTQALALYKAQLLDAMNPAQAFALEMERQGRVLEAAAGRARDFEQQRQAILQKRGAQPNEPLTPQESSDINAGLDTKYAAQAKDNHRVAQEATEDAKTLARAQASTSPGALVAAQGQIAYRKAIRETTDALHPNGDVQAAQQAKQDALAKGYAEMSGQIGAQVTQLNLQTQAQQRLADAAGQGEAAQRRANIENQVAAAAIKGVEKATRDQLEAQEKLAQVIIRKEFEADINRQIAANDRLAVAYGKSETAVEDANRYTEAYAQTLREYPESMKDMPAYEDLWTVALNRNIEKLKERDLSKLAKDISAYSAKLRSAQDDLNVERVAVGLSDTAALELRARYNVLKSLGLTIEQYNSLNAVMRQGVDTQMDAAAAIAKQQQEVQNYKSAWDTVNNSLEKSFERIGDALVDAIVQGKDASLDFGKLWKSIAASMFSDFAKLASVDLRRAIGLGGNTQGSLLDLFSGPSAGGSSSAANQNGGMGGMGGQALSLGSKFIPSSWTNGITSSIDSLGYSSLGIGSVGGWASAAPASVTAATAAPITGAASANAATGVAAAGNTATANTLYSGTTSGASGAGVTGGLTSYLGALGAGFAAGGLIGPLLANGNKAVGGLAGGASGAAAGALVGSIVPGVGTLIGALLGGAGGGLGGLLGTQKPTVGKTASSDVTISNGVASYGNILTDNKGDPEAGKALGQTVAAIFNAAKAGGGSLVKDFGFGQTEKGGFYVGGSVPTKEFKDDFAGMIRYALLDQGGLQNGGVNTLAALRNSTSKDAGEFAKDVALGASIDAGNTALKEMVKTLGGVTDAAKKATTESFAPMFEELSRAQKLGIDGAYKALATDQLKAYLDQLRNPPDYTQMQTDVATLTGQFQAAREAYAQLNPEMVAYVDQIQAETMARLAANQNRQLDQQIAEASGRGYVNQISGFLDTLSVNARSLAAVGQPVTRAQTLFNASLTGLLRTLTADQLTDVVATFGGDIGALATAIQGASAATTVATAAQEQAARFETLIGQIRQDNVQAEISALNEQKSAANSLLSSWKNVVSGVSQARQSLLVGDLSTLDPRAKMDTALAAYRDALGRAQGGDVDAAGQVAGLAQTALTAARAYYASNEDYARIFNEVMGGLGSVESAASRQVSLQSATVSRLDSQLSVQQDMLRALQQNPADIAAILSGLNSSNSNDIGTWASRQDSGTQAAVKRARLEALGNADIERLFGGFSDIQAARAANPLFNLAEWFKGAGINEVMAGTRSIPGFANGGIVGNGIYGVDSVVAAYAGGGNIALAGGEGVLTAAATSAIGAGTVDYINRNRALPANDRWGGSNVVPYQPRSSSNSGGQSADIKRQNELLEEQNRLLTALLRTTAAAGDSNNAGLQQVADGVSAVVRKVSGGGATR